MRILLLLFSAMVSFGSSEEVRSLPRSPVPDYIRGVFTELKLDGEIRPTDLEKGPTSVWVQQDTGILNNSSNYRNSTSRQVGVYDFHFDWSSVPKTADIYLDKGSIRMHLRSLSNCSHSNGAEAVAVVVSAEVSVNILNGSDSPATSKPFSAPSTTANFTVIGNYSEWVEVDVTEGLRAVWERANSSVVVITVQLTAANHQASEPVPAEIVDPMSVSLGDRTSRYLSLQPLLLLYLQDRPLKARAMMALSIGAAASRDDGMLLEFAAVRASRSAPSGACRLSNYTVHFEDVGIHSVMQPSSLNVGVCSGGCTVSYQRQMTSGSVTNHASILAAADIIQPNPDSKEITCCSPLNYYPVYLLVVNSNSEIRFQLFMDLVVSSCGCQ